MQNPLVSILTPFKNTSQFLEECVTSILNQTYANWELIAVNDHSDDNSLKLMEQLRALDDRVKLYNNEGNGIIDALQMAFKKSTGALITRMDSDDVMLSNKLEVLVKQLQTYGRKHVAIGKVKYFNADGVGPGYKSYEMWLNRLTETGSNYDEIYKECVIPSPCWMVFREDLKHCGGFNYHIYPEDYDLTFRFYKNKYKCIPCNEVIHKWRDYSTRTSRIHEYYAQNHFTTLKVHHFLDIDYNPNKTLVIWGAGTKGKLMARMLIDRNIDFKWICDNPNKIGKKIYGKTMLNFNALGKIKNAQSLITVANRNAQNDIRAYLNTLHLQSFKDYIFFC